MRKRFFFVLSKGLRIGLSLLCLIFSFVNSTTAQAQHQKAVQAVMDKAVEGPYVGMIVCVNGPDGNQGYAAGWMDREKGLPARPDALFKIASISKLYIAAATTKLICIDSLDLEDTLAELIPEVQGRIDKADPDHPTHDAPTPQRYP